MAATAVHPDQLRFQSDATLRWYDPVPSVHYGFCSTCGSTLFWRADDVADKLCVAAGTLDQPTGLSTTQAWWVAEAGDYHERAPGVIEIQYEDGAEPVSSPQSSPQSSPNEAGCQSASADLGCSP